MKKNSTFVSMKHLLLIIALFVSILTWGQGTLSTLQNMHKVKKGETIESIATQYGISSYELRKANPEIKKKKKLKKGTLLLIPQQETSQDESQEVAETTSATEDEMTIKMETYPVVRIAVLLPLEDENECGKNMVEFYQGLLMAADSVKTRGTDIVIHALHSGSTAQEMQDILSKNDLSEMHLVIGPENESQLPVLLQYCQEHALRLALPFHTKADIESENAPLYLPFPTSQQPLQDVIQRMCNTENKRNYIILDSGKADVKGTYAVDAFREIIEREGDDSKIMPLNSTTSMGEYFNAETENIIIPDNTDIRTFNIFSAKMSSYLQMHPECQITLFGFSEWMSYTSNILQSLFSMNTYIPTQSYYNPLDAETAAFEKRFTKNFRTTMRPYLPRYAIMGFDMGYYFLQGLAENGDFFEEYQGRLSYESRQTPLTFIREKDKNTYVNQAVMTIHYTKENSIEIIR